MAHLHFYSLSILSFCFISCQNHDISETEKIIPYTDSAVEDSGGIENIDCDTELGQIIEAPLSLHFQNWLNENDYHSDSLSRTDIENGSFGGLLSDDDCIKKEPVVFIHGNSDQALGGLYGGWSEQLAYFISKGYRSAELYATTYGHPLQELSTDYYHRKSDLLQIRHFLEAVISYTKVEKIDIIAHSLGVTMARRAILGGIELDSEGNAYDLGEPLTAYIDSFVGIAGANQGLSSCAYSITPICSSSLGLYPGWWSGYSVNDQSQFIQTINEKKRYEGDYLFSIWSVSDLILGPNCLVWGVNSCQLPEQDAEYSSALLDHFGLRSETIDIQYSFITAHQLP